MIRVDLIKKRPYTVHVLRFHNIFQINNNVWTYGPLLSYGDLDLS
jgi:hypothetical protein